MSTLVNGCFVVIHVMCHLVDLDFVAVRKLFFSRQGKQLLLDEYVTGRLVDV